MRRLLALAFVLLAVPASAQIQPSGLPQGPPIVGLPSSAVNGGGQIPAGSGGAMATVCGVLNVDTTQAGTGANTTETDLWTYTLPANTLSANGKGLRFQAFGSFAANANNKTVKLYFGATAINDSFAIAANGTNWEITGVLLRTSATAQISETKFRHGTSSVSINIKTPAETLSGDVVIRITGQNGSANANDIVFRGVIVECLN